MNSVRVHVQSLSIPTYRTAKYEHLPMFAENRVHQRSSGNPYPNPIVNQVQRDEKINQVYEAVILENRYIQLIILPEIGGRIFGALDKTNNYDFFYRQHVIKPVLIGMLGSWISGGVEFNWPIHHRPSTFLPVDYEIEQGGNGSVTVWLSEHEPLDRMKGMVGISLHPNRAIFETKMRIYNRTYLPKSFLWWENAAVPVNPDYQIFFPQDVTYVSFHYKKSTGGYPVMNEFFNTQDNRGCVDIRQHKNTTEATSYFSGKSKFDFFGGYDHGRKAGVIHIGSCHTSVGKKMFTWGYSQLSRSWEDALTDTDGAYAELMAGSYSDNQPDFTWLEPFETKIFNQSWYPYKEIGEPKNANCQLAMNYEINGNSLKILLYPTERFENALVAVKQNGKTIGTVSLTLEAAVPDAVRIILPHNFVESDFEIIILQENGCKILSYTPPDRSYFVPSPRKDNPAPDQLPTADDCYLVGLHVAQYRDPVTKPDVYWQQGLQLDPNHAGCLNGLGVFYLERCCYVQAEEYLRRAVASLTRWNPNPVHTEAYYYLGLALKAQGKLEEAYDLFHKSLWNRRVSPQSCYCIAQIDCIRGNYKAAKLQLNQMDGSNQKARCLLATVLRVMGEIEQASEVVKEILFTDPLDYFTLNEQRLLSGNEMFLKMHSNPAQTCLDIAFDYADAGFYDCARELLLALEQKLPAASAYPMVQYALGYFSGCMGNPALLKQYYRQGADSNFSYCFPSREWELKILLDVIEKDPKDANAMRSLGSLLYSKGQYNAAISYWERSAEIEPDCAEIWRNLALGHFNRNNKSSIALSNLQKATVLDPNSVQLSYELNLLAELMGLPVEKRMELLSTQKTKPDQRDDLYLQAVRLQNQMGNYEKALQMLADHVFVPCEGGEHDIAEQYSFAHFALGHTALVAGDFYVAMEHFIKAQTIPVNLGGGFWHRVMRVPYVYYTGVCRRLSGDEEGAKADFMWVADIPVDYFTNMYLPSFRYYRGLALNELGQPEKGAAELAALLSDAQEGLAQKDFGYFASTPYFHSYWENPQTSRWKHYGYLLALAQEGLGRQADAIRTLQDLLKLSPCHLMGAFLYNMLVK